MLSAKDLADVLWEDSELAFVEVESRARKWLRTQWEEDPRSQEDYRPAYMNAVITAAHELEIPILNDWKLVSASDSNINEAYERFILQVDSYTLTVTIRRARSNDYTVALESATKTKIHHLIGRIRDHIDAADLAPDKKDGLFRKLNAFAAEVDRQRMGMQVFGAFVAGVSGAIGQAVERSKVIEVMDAIARMIGHDKSKEDNQRPKLPAPKPPKRIEGPPERPARGGWDKPKEADLAGC